ncbi:acetate--CoA ligase family protein [Tepidiforma sp.]|uniref:acetate--CoA ligase family protein n=1 Tax=Tepidiforma sp. TaxID=2682230 RepID=UPI002ADDFD17|nr:CoA-binding protein [Tepidiforma sp.]
MTNAPALDFIFHPRSIAIAGVSAKEGPGFGGGGFVASLQEIGFRGPIYLIHPTAPAIRGLKCYRSLLDIPDDVDYVISSVPARAVPQLLEDCIRKNVRVLHLFTAGFTETGDVERAKMEQAVVARAREAGIRIIGPNCMGLYVPASRLAMMPGQPPEPGPVGMVSQSGMNAGEFVRYATPRGVRCSKVISFGNGADLKAADFLDYLTDDPETEIIVAYLEGIQDGPRLAQVIRRAGATKPLVILKSGRTEAGSRAANSHTASLAGSLQVFDALCRQAGAIRVESLEELTDMAVTFQFVRELRGPNIVVVGGGGGASVLAADDLNAAGLELPPLLPETQAELAKVTHEAGTSIRNPIDTTSMWEDEGFDATLRPIAAAPNIHVILYHTSFGSGPSARFGDPRNRMARQAETLGRIQQESGKPVVVAIRPATNVEGFQQSLDFQEMCWRAGIATYPSIARAGVALGHLLRWQRMRQGLSVAR